MNTFGRLGELYDLSPATLGVLAQKADMPVDPSWTGGAPPAGPPVPVDPSVSHSAPGADPNAPTSLFTRPMGPPSMDAAKDLTARQTQADYNAGVADTLAARGGSPAQSAPTASGESMGMAAPQQQGGEVMSGGSPYVPGHMQLSSRETSHEGGLQEPFATGFAQNRFAQAENLNEANNIGLRNDVVMRRAMQVTNAARSIDDLNRFHAQKQADNEAARQAFIKQNQDQVAQAASDAGRQVDPDDIWKGNTFGRVMAAIAIGLGEFGSTLTHTENGAAKIIQGAIRDNIDSQKTNIANARGRLGDLRQQKLDKIAELDDDTDRHAALTLMYTDQVKQIAMDWAVKNGLDPNGPKVREVMAGMDRISADAFKDVGTTAGGKWTEKETQKYKDASGGAGAVAVKREGNLVTSADGTTYHFGDDATAQKATAKLQAYGDVQVITNKILQLRAATMKLDPVMDHKAYEANMLQLKMFDDQLQNAEATASGQGVVTAQDVERRKKVGLDATAGLGIFKGAANVFGSADFDSANKAFEAASKMNSDRQGAFVQAAGGEVYQRDYARDAQGNLIPTGRFTGQDAKPQQALTPRSAVQMDSRHKPLNVAGASDRDTTPYAPVRSGTVTVKSSQTSKKK